MSCSGPGGFSIGFIGRFSRSRIKSCDAATWRTLSLHFKPYKLSRIDADAFADGARLNADARLDFNVATPSHHLINNNARVRAIARRSWRHDTI